MSFEKYVLSQTQSSIEYLKWASSHKSLKVVETKIPDGILPKNIRNATLSDVRVFSKRRVPDDKIYESSAQLRAKVARGNSLLTFSMKLSNDEWKNNVAFFPVFALRKFTGGMGDDDDQEIPTDNSKKKNLKEKEKDNNKNGKGGKEEKGKGKGKKVEIEEEEEEEMIDDEETIDEIDDSSELDRQIGIEFENKSKESEKEKEIKKNAIKEQELAAATALWRQYFVSPPEDASLLISTAKENGAAGHLSAFKFEDQFYIFAGSKNVHILVKKREDIEKYANDTRFSVAKKVANAIFDTFESIGQENTKGLLNYLSETHFTACFELIDPEDQHVEFIDLKTPEIRFFAFTIYEGENTTVCRNPLEGIKIMENFGVKVVYYDVIELDKSSRAKRVEQLDEHFLIVRNLYNTEGRVLYFLNENNQVIGLLKKKSIWYIILRAIREKVKLYGITKVSYPATRDSLKSKIAKRFKEIQFWLSLSNDSIAEWTKIALDFSSWVCEKLEKKRLQASSLANNFPPIWKSFLEETNASDRIAV